MKTKGKKKIIGTAQKPRLCVFRSNEHIYAQAIDDTTASTLVSCSTLDPYVKEILETLKIENNETIKTYNSRTCRASIVVGLVIAERLLKKEITTVKFDKRNKLYHGRIKALADGARKAGLSF
jgi:large subunit ribosomal protein L18